MNEHIREVNGFNLWIRRLSYNILSNFAIGRMMKLKKNNTSRIQWIRRKLCHRQQKLKCRTKEWINDGKILKWRLYTMSNQMLGLWRICRDKVNTCKSLTISSNLKTLTMDNWRIKTSEIQTTRGTYWPEGASQFLFFSKLIKTQCFTDRFLARWFEEA